MALKRIFILLGMLLISHAGAARGGLLFNVSSAGTPTHLSITLCLNGKGPLSCQNYTVDHLHLIIKPTVPNHVYPAIGIKVNTPGYALMGCTPYGNGHCLFSASSTSPAEIDMSDSTPATTLTSSLDLLALSVNCPPTTVGCVYTNPALSGVPRQITMTNSGVETATNVSVITSGFPSGTSISANTCTGSLAPSSSCVITLTPGTNASTNCTSGTEPTKGTVTVNADNATAKQVDLLVLSYSCIYQGGYIYHVDDTTPITRSIGGRVVAQFDQMSPPNGIFWSADNTGAYVGNSIWGVDETSTENSPSPNSGSSDPATKYTGQNDCNGATDGACNTQNIVVYYTTVASPATPLTAYAAGLCRFPISGYTDWYLPAICEMGPDAFAQNICASPPLPFIQQNMAQNLPSLVDACTGQQCLVGDHWSSTEQLNNTEDTAWSECFASGGASDQCVDGKNDATIGVRCARFLTY